MNHAILNIISKQAKETIIATSYKYGCPTCEYQTPFERAYQTALAKLRRHRKTHS